MGKGNNILLAGVGVGVVAGLAYAAGQTFSLAWPRGLNLDGTQHAEVSWHKNPAKKLTIEALIEPAVVNERLTIVSRWNPAYAGGWSAFQFGLWVYESGELLFVIGDSKGGFQYTSPRPQIIAGQRTHIIETMDEQAIHTIVNGVETVAPTARVVTSLSPLKDLPVVIGATRVVPGQYVENFKGTIYFVKGSEETVSLEQARRRFQAVQKEGLI